MHASTLVAVLLIACGGADTAPEGAPAPGAPPAEAAGGGDPGAGGDPAGADAGAADAPEAQAETAPAEHPGKAVYNQYCVACHQADGKGMNGTLAGNFVGDATILAKPDDVLLKHIAEGYVGSVGSMPAWKGTLSDQQMKDALAYVRATYGG